MNRPVRVHLLGYSAPTVILTAGAARTRPTATLSRRPSRLCCAVFLLILAVSGCGTPQPEMSTKEYELAACKPLAAAVDAGGRQDKAEFDRLSAEGLEAARNYAEAYPESEDANALVDYAEYMSSVTPGTLSEGDLEEMDRLAYPVFTICGVRR